MLINLLNELRYNRACAVKNNREVGKNLADLLKNVKAKLGFLTGLEFVCAVACPDSDCKRVNACLCYKVINLAGMCVRCVLIRNINIILNACELAELTLNNNAVCVSLLNNLFGKSNVLIIGEM